MKPKVFALLAVLLMFVGVGFSSCDKSGDEPTVPQKDQDATTSLSVPSKMRAVTDWENYPRLTSTGNRTKYFSSGEYAAKIYRHWWNGTLKTLVRAAQSAQGSGIAYCSVTKYDGNGNVLANYGPTMLDESNHYPFGSSTIDISGDEYLVIILDVRDSGDYMCWFWIYLI